MGLVKICSCGTKNPEKATFCSKCPNTLADIHPTEETVEEFTAPVDPSSIAVSTSETSECKHVNLHENYCRDCQAWIEPAAVFTGDWSLKFSWGNIAINDSLWIGRMKPAPEELTARLEENHPNVSRNHAQLSVQNNVLYIRDLDSTNGTFVNGEKIPPMQMIELGASSQIRFAKDLEAEVVLEKKI